MLWIGIVLLPIRIRLPIFMPIQIRIHNTDHGKSWDDVLRRRQCSRLNLDFLCPQEMAHGFHFFLGWSGSRPGSRGSPSTTRYGRFSFLILLPAMPLTSVIVPCNARFRIRFHLNKAVLRIRDPVLFWPLEPGSGMEKKSRARIGNSYFWELSISFFMRIRIRDIVNLDPGWIQLDTG